MSAAAIATGYIVPTKVRAHRVCTRSEAAPRLIARFARLGFHDERSFTSCTDWATSVDVRSWGLVPVASTGCEASTDHTPGTLLACPLPAVATQITYACSTHGKYGTTSVPWVHRLCEPRHL